MLPFFHFVIITICAYSFRSFLFVFISRYTFLHSLFLVWNYIWTYEMRWKWCGSFHVFFKKLLTPWNFRVTLAQRLRQQFLYWQIAFYMHGWFLFATDWLLFWYSIKKNTIFRFFVSKPFRFLTLIINLHKL